jgi:shikimate kinase
MASGDPPAGTRRIVLVGFMGSGKSTVGSLVAARLGWSFLDFDDEIERRAGLSVEEIFRQRGEASFRTLEAEVGEELLRTERTVLATGGGWAAAPGRMEALDAGTLSVWLDVSAGTAVRRLREGGRPRPLLGVPDASEAAERLLEARRAWYGRARLRLDVEGASPEALAEEICRNAVSGSDP